MRRLGAALRDLLSPRVFYGTHRYLHGWTRWLPLYVSPVWFGTRFHLLHINGIAIGVFGRIVYVFFD